MELTYWGTGAAESIPALFCNCRLCRTAVAAGGRDIRTRSGALIDGVLKIDFPPDINAQRLARGFDLTALRHLLITHPHEDHYAVWDLLYRTEGFYLPEYETVEPLVIYGGREVGEIFEEKFRGRQQKVLRVRYERMLPYQPKAIADYTVTALRSRHMPGSEAFLYRIERQGRALLYAHDSGAFYEETYDHLKGKLHHLVSLDCTYMNRDTLDEAETNGHMGAPMARRVRERLMQIGAADEKTVFVLNHFSHNGGLTHEELVKTNGDFVIAYDGLSVTV